MPDEAAGQQVEHVTRRGDRYPLLRVVYQQLITQAAGGPGKREFSGALLAIGLVVAAVVVQLRASDPMAGSITGLTADGLASHWFWLWGSLFVHRGTSHLLPNGVLLLLFGVNLGWRRGPWHVFWPFFLGGATGVLVGLVGLPTDQPVLFGSDGAVAGVTASAMVLLPRTHERDGWIPWNLLGGYLLFAVWPLCPTAPSAVLVGGATAGLLAAVVLVRQPFRDITRLSAVFLLIGLWLAGRLGDLVLGLAENPLAWVLYLRLAGALFLLAIATIYVAGQYELVRDRIRWGKEDVLDELVAKAVAHQDTD